MQEAGRIAYRAIEPGKAIFDGGTCEGKAALVLRGRDAVVDGLVFQNMRVPDGNGAGIRLEKGPLLVKNAVFRDSEEGILTADDPASAIRSIARPSPASAAAIAACPARTRSTSTPMAR